MSFSYKEPVEICHKQEGLLVKYYRATLLAAIGRNRYLVRYETRLNHSGTRLLTEPVDAEQVRPLPPPGPYINFIISDRVDAYINNAWWVGKIARKVDPNYYVRLDYNGNEVHCAYYRVRLHLDWVDDKWVHLGSGTQNGENQGNTSQQGS
ncbi:Agenet domain-containing protein [Cephalotus follicularis]|uniref:Agenet domain-containing protein n=1 Tax=Cephalotus follicularis TaxID=3775 RepID=A0A1Q3AY27_CEPFO|nr:Agenet domain-containing protein [Cephalotus follicularis]